MDSVTQAVLGAAVGGLCLGDRLGRRALLLGAAVGTIPDLDVLATPFLDPVAGLTAHRTYTHNLLFLALLTPLLGWLLARWQRRAEVSLGRWIAFCGWCLGSAVALDCFTSYGVPLFYPFSERAIAIASIAVVDPLYTLPLLLAVLAALGLKADARRRALVTGLMLANVYLAASVLIKLHAARVFETELARQGIVERRLLAKPTFFNTLLWRGVAETEDAFWVGYYSLLDPDRRVSFRRFPKGRELIEGLEEKPAVRAVATATDGMFQAVRAGGRLVLRDLRYGTGTDWLPPALDRPFVFAYRMEAGGEGLTVLSGRRGSECERLSLRFMFSRALGERGLPPWYSPAAAASENCG